MRLIVVSNRAPVTVVDEDGRHTYRQSAGGLATGLRSYLDTCATADEGHTGDVWIGWPGAIPPEEDEASIAADLMRGHDVRPVFLSEEDVRDYYDGFCNQTLWPLFHYFTSFTSYRDDQWECYKRVNEKFCDAIMEELDEDAKVWVHDYHLMLVPGMVRKRAPDATIGFFLHIPFPSYELFRLLPSRWREELLEGLLGADLVGFHTYDYTQYFLRCVLKILGNENSFGQIERDARFVKADTFPMGIDYARFADTCDTAEVREKLEDLRGQLSDQKVILSVDRLDYTKGIVNKLHAYELFLDQNPEWHGKVVLTLVVVPSRTGVMQYEEIKAEIDEIVGSINGRYGSIDWTPILYQYKALPFEELLGLYRLGDVAMVTPERDGMNLIAKEYLSCRLDGSGVLLLSEMAGASSELGEALVVNPNSTSEMADGLLQALETPRDDQVARNRPMQQRLRRYDVVHWAREFLGELLYVKHKQESRETSHVDTGSLQRLLADYAEAKNRLLAIDYDGTLVPLTATPGEAVPGRDAKDLLGSLATDSRNRVMLVSGRDRQTLEKWFGELNVMLVAEHGAWTKSPGMDWATTRPLSSEWKVELITILETYVDRLPRSFVEEKEFSIAWHYRRSDPELGSLRVRELFDELLALTANINVQVIQGSKVIEIRNSGVDKGYAVAQAADVDSYDFVLALGDDWTDEDMFKVLPERAYTLRIGTAPTSARFTLRDQRNAFELLKQLTRVDQPSLRSP